MQVFMLILSILFNILMIGVIIKCLLITKNKNIKKTYKTIIFLLFGLGILLVVTAIGRYIYDAFHGNDIVFLAANFLYISAIIVLTIAFIKSSYVIAKNIKNKQLFVEENAVQLDNISHFFLYYSLFASVSGIFINVIKMISNKMIIASFSMSYTFLLYLILGIVFHIISVLFRKSIEAYEENKLTI